MFCSSYLRIGMGYSLSSSPHNQLARRNCIRNIAWVVGERSQGMTVTKETVPLEGTLKGEGYRRMCHVRATRRETYADECPRPICVSYSRCDIEDDDHFPDGNYELILEGHTILLIKKSGLYMLR